MGADRAGHLAHDHHGQLFLGVDPEEGTCAASPQVLALGALNGGQAIVLTQPTGSRSSAAWVEA